MNGTVDRKAAQPVNGKMKVPILNLDNKLSQSFKESHEQWDGTEIPVLREQIAEATAAYGNFENQLRPLLSTIGAGLADLQSLADSWAGAQSQFAQLFTQFAEALRDAEPRLKEAFEASARLGMAGGQCRCT